ncbi:MAG TPA: DUF3800 domain-containing protein [Candidatus Binataceae bacterium]|nr:DUF3800 domain-containing protein [Candidatus Binataceae bacterium]
MLTPTGILGKYEGYSAFTHMVDALFLRDEALMAIIIPDPLTLYCDASGKETDRVFVVGGVLSTVGNWREFDAKWGAALAANDLSYFRMSEFAHSVGQFKKGWKTNELRRQAFLHRLVSIFVGHVKFWMGACIYRSDFDKANEVYELEERFQPYTLCAHTCVSFANKWRDSNHLDYLPLEYVFEENDPHFGQLSDRLFEHYKQRPIPRKKIELDPTKMARPLQASDFAAYEVRKAFVGLDVESARLFNQFRKSFLLLRKTPHVWGFLNEEHIRTLANVMGVQKRLVPTIPPQPLKNGKED